MLVDTSVLVRTLQPHHSLYAPADRAIRLLPEQGRELHVVPQNLIELWTVATRPLGENGLGMTAVEAAAELERIKGMFIFLPDTAAIYPAWEALVLQHQVWASPCTTRDWSPLSAFAVEVRVARGLENAPPRGTSRGFPAGVEAAPSLEPHSGSCFIFRYLFRGYNLRGTGTGRNESGWMRDEYCAGVAEYEDNGNATYWESPTPAGYPGARATTDRHEIRS
ncbi:MAG: hypothetical protein JWO80_2302 [Bryobacterales bacterium]|nr:hypothetical protein [Bryobacterales bacterium]